MQEENVEFFFRNYPVGAQNATFIVKAQKLRFKSEWPTMSYVIKNHES